MPLTAKGQEIMANMEKEYGSKEKAQEVFYASRNAGKITGVDTDPPPIVTAASLNAYHDAKHGRRR